MKIKLIKYFSFIMLLGAGVVFTTNFLPGYFLSKILGAHASGRLSFLQLLKGNIRIEDVNIYSSQEFLFAPAIFIRQIDIRIGSLRNKVIKDINISGLSAMRIHDANYNTNLEQLRGNINEYLKRRKAIGIYRVENLEIEKSLLVVFYLKDKKGAGTMDVPAVQLKDLSEPSDSIYDAVTQAICRGIFKEFDSLKDRNLIDKVSDFFS